MTPILLALALSAFALGFYLGREAGKAPGLTSCPKCRQKRLYYCRGCGVQKACGDFLQAPAAAPMPGCPNAAALAQLRDIL